MVSDIDAEVVYLSEGRISMDDNNIIQLYWDRNHDAINATNEKYGRPKRICVPVSAQALRAFLSFLFFYKDRINQ